MIIQKIDSKLETINRIRPNFKVNKVKLPANKVKELWELGGMAGVLGLSQLIMSEKANKKPTSGYLNKELSKEELNQANVLCDTLKVYSEAISFEEFQNITMKVNEIPPIISQGFIEAVVDFANTNSTTSAYKNSSHFFSFLRGEQLKDFMNIVSLNNTEVDDLDFQVSPRFSLEDIVDLGQVYCNFENKPLFLDLIRDIAAVDDTFSDIKYYRFDKEEIISLADTYKKTPYKQLFIDAIAKKEAIQDQKNKTGEFTSEIILDLVENCENEKDADFLSEILTKKYIDKYGNKVEYFTGHDIYVLRGLYCSYPEEVQFLVSEKQKDSKGRLNPRFNTEEIAQILKYKESLGEDFLNIIKQSNELNTLSLFTLLNKFKIAKTQSLQSSKRKNNNKKLN